MLKERLRDLGAWLTINGEAIYGSKPWIAQNDTSNGNVWYTSSADGSAVYAISLEWPDDDLLVVSLPKVEEGNTEMKLLGAREEGNLKFSEKSGEEYAVEISFPSMSRVVKKCGIGCNWAYVVKMTGLKNSAD